MMTENQSLQHEDIRATAIWWGIFWRILLIGIAINIVCAIVFKITGINPITSKAYKEIIAGIGVIWASYYYFKQFFLNKVFFSKRGVPYIISADSTDNRGLTLSRVRRLWWAWQWRNIAANLAATFVAGALISVGLGPIIALLVILCVNIGAAYWFFLYILRKDFEDFRVMFMESDKTNNELMKETKSF